MYYNVYDHLATSLVLCSYVEAHALNYVHEKGYNLLIAMTLMMDKYEWELTSTFPLFVHPSGITVEQTICSSNMCVNIIMR